MIVAEWPGCGRRWYVRQETMRLEHFLECRARSYLVPEYQRPYVWGVEHRTALLESIVAGTPIGTILLWRPERDDATYVLDGQQRVTSLVRMTDKDEPDPAFQGAVTSSLDGVVTTLPLWMLVDYHPLTLMEWSKSRHLSEPAVRLVLDVVAHLRDYEIAITTVVGPETYAREVYVAHNTTGVAVDVDIVRRPTAACPTIADVVASARYMNQTPTEIRSER